MGHANNGIIFLYENIDDAYKTLSQNLFGGLTLSR